MHNSIQTIDRNLAHLPVIYLTKSLKELSNNGKKIAGTNNSSLLIFGEKGTGKELLARAIHYSLSNDATFVSINCANLTIDNFVNKINDWIEHLSDAENISHNETNHRKLTFYISNIEKMETDIQNVFFDFLKKKVIESQNSSIINPVNLRLFFSVNENGQKQKICDIFDESLNKSFNPFLLSILPLRNRSDDIKPLALHFLEKFGKEYGKRISKIHSEAFNILQSHQWPGNVSELRDVMENAVLLSQGPLITADNIRLNISKKSIILESFLSNEDFFKLDELEKIYIQTVLKRLKNNKSKAAKVLGISRNTLQRRVDAFSTEKPSKSKKNNKKSTQPSLF